MVLNIQFHINSIRLFCVFLRVFLSFLFILITKTKCVLRISSRRIYHIYSAIFSVIIFSFANIQYILLSCFWRPVSVLHSYNSVLRIQTFFLYSYKMWILICKLAHMLLWRKIHNYIIAWKFGSKTFKEAKILSSKKKFIVSERTDVKYSYSKKTI